VEQVLTSPQQIVVEGDVFVAQSQRGEGLLRVVFVEIGSTKRILTLFWTNQVNRYWQEESMNVKYDAEADILIFIFRDTFPANAISEPGGMIVSYDDNGEPISIEFLNASKRHLFNPQELQLTITT